MNFILQNWWLLFLGFFLLFMLTAFWMRSVALHFYIPSQKLRFSIFDLEFPVSESQLFSLLRLMGSKEKAALRRHLWIDFLFMPAAYIGIALLCVKTADKMSAFGKYVFWGLAVLQALPWLFDMLENAYLLKKLGSMDTLYAHPEKNSPLYKWFQIFVRAKFAIALIGAVCSLFGLLYFWVIGAYQKESLLYLGVLLLMVLLFSLAGKVFTKKPVLAEE